MADVWEMFRVIIEERKRREIDPTLLLLRQCLAESGKGKEEKHSRQKISEMLGFMESMSGCYEEIRGLPTTGLVQFVKMGGKVKKLLGL
jgi:DNA-binding transcriptional regulator GbsR (MarR family)